ncbi:MAG TPA: amidohydrolase family protein [Chloroflexota bacterium]|nr:amidohydrolase family protein [Chloroflexota bacterium]
MPSKDFPVFDCDSHIVEPAEIWDEYVPAAKREFVKEHFYNPLVAGYKVLNGRRYPYSASRSISATSSWVPGRSSAENRRLIGTYEPGTPEYDQHLGKVAATWNPRARLNDMDAMGIDQVMVFPSHLVYLPLVRNPEAATLLATAYNDWAYDYCQANPRRLFPCGLLALQDADGAIAELRRLAQRGFKTVAVRPVLWNGRYPTFEEFDPLWRELEASGLVLGMHTFPSSEPLSSELAAMMQAGSKQPDAGAADAPFQSGAGLWREVAVYSPGQLVQNIVNVMGVPVNASENVGFMFEAMTWLTIVLMTGWLEKFPRLMAAVLESNASWLPLILEKAETFLEVHAYHRPVQVGDPEKTFARQCFIAFETDEDPVYRMWDVYEDVGIWSSDYPHHDGADAWEAIERMNRWNVPPHVQAKLLGGNARRMYGIEPELAVSEPPADYAPLLEPTVGLLSP